MMQIRALGPLVLAALLLAPALRAEDISKEFTRVWQDAGEDESKKRAALDRLAKERSAEGAKLLVAVALMPAEAGPIVDHAISRLAELEGSDGDAWMRDQLKRNAHWADRAILA